MLINRIKKIVLAGIIIGFFLPFINTCTRQDREDREGGNVEVDQKKTSFSKPDGENYSGIGYIISDFQIDHLLIWSLIVSFIVAIILLLNQFFHFFNSELIAFWSGLTGILGLLFLLYLEELSNLKYGFWISLSGYIVFLFSFVPFLVQRISQKKSPA